MPGSTWSFGVFKKGRNGIKPHILQIDTTRGCICFAKRGLLKHAFPFHTISDISSGSVHRHMVCFDVCKREGRVKRYICFTQTAAARDKIASALHSVLSRVQQGNRDITRDIGDILGSHGMLHHSGKIEKKGKVKWSDRWLILQDGKCIVYRHRDDLYPVNIIELNNASTAILGDSGFRLYCLDRHFDFKGISNQERDMWCSKIQQEVKESNRMNFRDAPKYLPDPMPVLRSAIYSNNNNNNNSSMNSSLYGSSSPSPNHFTGGSVVLGGSGDADSQGYFKPRYTVKFAELHALLALPGIDLHTHFGPRELVYESEQFQIWNSGGIEPGFMAPLSTSRGVASPTPPPPPSPPGDFSFGDFVHGDTTVGIHPRIVSCLRTNGAFPVNPIPTRAATVTSSPSSPPAYSHAPHAPVPTPPTPSPPHPPTPRFQPSTPRSFGSSSSFSGASTSLATPSLILPTTISPPPLKRSALPNTPTPPQLSVRTNLLRGILDENYVDNQSASPDRNNTGNLPNGSIPSPRPSSSVTTTSNHSSHPHHQVSPDQVADVSDSKHHSNGNNTHNHSNHINNSTTTNHTTTSNTVSSPPNGTSTTPQLTLRTKPIGKVTDMLANAATLTYLAPSPSVILPQYSFIQAPPTRRALEIEPTSVGKGSNLSIENRHARIYDYNMTSHKQTQSKDPSARRTLNLEPVEKESDRLASSAPASRSVLDLDRSKESASSSRFLHAYPSAAHSDGLKKHDMNEFSRPKSPSRKTAPPAVARLPQPRKASPSKSRRKASKAAPIARENSKSQFLPAEKSPVLGSYGDGRNRRAKTMLGISRSKSAESLKLDPPLEPELNSTLSASVSRNENGSSSYNSFFSANNGIGPIPEVDDVNNNGALSSNRGNQQPPASTNSSSKSTFLDKQKRKSSSKEKQRSQTTATDAHNSRGKKGVFSSLKFVVGTHRTDM